MQNNNKMRCKKNCEIEMTTNFHVTNFHSMKFKITLSPCFFYYYRTAISAISSESDTEKRV